MNDRARLGQECCEGWAQSPDGQAAPPPPKTSATRGDRAEAGRMGGEEDKPGAGAGREVEGVASRLQCLLRSSPEAGGLAWGWGSLG